VSSAASRIDQANFTGPVRFSGNDQHLRMNAYFFDQSPKFANNGASLANYQTTALGRRRGSSMGDFLSRISSSDLPILLLFGGGIGAGVIAILASCFYMIRKNDNETRLKQDMLSRGMSADEIKAVLDAGKEKDS